MTHHHAAATHATIAAVISAEATLAAAVSPAIAARERRDAVLARIADKHTERAAIAAARAAGERHPDDAGRVALADMDIAALQSILADAEAVVAEASRAETVAISALATARAELEAAKSDEAAAALLDHLAAVQDVFSDTAGKLRETLDSMPSARARTLLEDLIPMMGGSLGAIVATVLWLGETRQRLGGLVAPWQGPTDLSHAVRVLVHQLGMQGY